VIAKWRLAQGCIEIYDTGLVPQLKFYLVSIAKNGENLLDWKRRRD
jgi:hypothetical protein